jgi:hypothetical protein
MVFKLQCTINFPSNFNCFKQNFMTRVVDSFYVGEKVTFKWHFRVYTPKDTRDGVLKYIFLHVGLYSI